MIPTLDDGLCNNNVSLLMDKAYEGDEVRSIAVSKGLEPVVPPKSNRKEPWEYDRKLYKRRNEPGTVIGDAALAGIRYPTLRKAADELDIKKAKETFSKRWIWSLPSDEDEPEPLAEFLEQPTFSEFDGLADPEEF